MDISIILGQFWGWILVLLCGIALVRRELLRDMLGAVKDRTFLLMTGLMSLMIGLITVILHNIWVMDWRVIITICGWFSIGKGIMFMAHFPIRGMAHWYRHNMSVAYFMLLVSLALGFFLIVETISFM